MSIIKNPVMSERMLELVKRIMVCIETGGVAAVAAADRRELQSLEEGEEYFLNILCVDMKFEGNDKFHVFEKCLPDVAVKYKRLLVIIHTFKNFLKNYSITAKYTLDAKALLKVIRCYLDDLSIIKKRYGCERIQLPKIAGLLTNLIVRCRPVVPVNIADNPHANINEAFAVYHALCVCSDFSSGAELLAFSKTGEHRIFYEDMVYLLNRNFTPENLIMVYKTLCLYQFKSFASKDIYG
jgi:hypothetical protein